MSAPSSFFTALRLCVQQSMRVGLAVSILLTCIVLTLVNFAHATLPDHSDAGDTQLIEGPDMMKSGGLLFKSESEYQVAPLLHTEVQISISGMIARAKVKQSFRNPTREWKEGVYVFPLPEDAAVDHMRMLIGERIIEGQIKEKAIAKKQYKAARKAGKKASLVEQERPNIFTTSVANIGPQETIVIEIEYQQVLKYDLGGFSLRFPTVVAPRYIPGTSHIDGFAGSGWANNTNMVADASRITPPVLHPDSGKINPLSMHIDLDAGFNLKDINSPYHQVIVEQKPGTGKYTIKLKEATIPADRDFVLNWQASIDSSPQAALFKEKKNDEEYALLMILPPKPAQKNILSREVIFVIDTSGSMAGTSILQAKSALQLALSRLKPGDRFNIIQFNSYTSQLFDKPKEHSSKSLRQARNYINALQANGGTEMISAIHAALKNQTDVQDLRQVVFLTDGSVGNENALFKDIETMLGDSRLFTIGIGSAPNSHFMNRAARFGRGTHTYIGDLSEVERKMAELFNKLAYPVLSQISLELSTDQSVEYWPQKIPDLYLGEPLLVSIKGSPLPRRIEVNGKIANAGWTSTLQLKGGQERAGVSGLWARRKIAALMEQELHTAEKENIRLEILNTALEHHLVSKYTSLLAVDITPARKRGELMNKHSMRTNLPSGWKPKKVFGTMPRTATPATLYFIVGIIMFLVSFIFRITRSYV